MKAEIKSVTWEKEYPNPFKSGEVLHLHKIIFINENLEQVKGFYSSVKKDQTNFIEGKEAEFTIEEMTNKNGVWFKIKPAKTFSQSNYGRAIKKEQSRYSGFAMSYAKDLVVANKIDYPNILNVAEEMLNWMVAADKKLEG